MRVRAHVACVEDLMRKEFLQLADEHAFRWLSLHPLLSVKV